MSRLGTKSFASCAVAVHLPVLLGLTLRGSDAGNGLVWRIEITELLVFALVSLVAAARDGVFILNTADLRIVADGLGVLVQIPDRPSRWIDDLGFFPIVFKKGFNPLRAYFLFCRGQEVQ